MTSHHDRSAIVMEVLTERTRQIEQEGWSIDHDDGHRRNELALAAAVYASPYPLRVQLLVQRPCGCRSVEECFHTFGTVTWVDAWPFRQGPKRMNRRRDLIRAAALIVAEIERLDRKDRP